MNAKDLAATREKLVECVAMGEDYEPLDALINRASNLYRFVRVAAWIFRFVGNVRARIRLKRTSETDTSHHTLAFGKDAPTTETRPDSKLDRRRDVEKCRNARSALIYVAQQNSFADDSAKLRKGQPV